MFAAYLIFVLSVIIASCRAQVPCAGPCVEPPPIPNLDPTKVEGRWYRYAGYPSCGFHGRCQSTTFSNYHNNIMMVHQHELPTMPGGLMQSSIDYRLNYLGESCFRIEGAEDTPNVNKTNTFYNTDYTSYLIKGICENVNGASMYTVWVLTRERNPPASVVSKIDELVKKNNLPRHYFVRTDQSNCPSDS